MSTAGAESSKVGAAHPTYMNLDVSWNPGALSSSHQPWANDCKACHSAPFNRVKDQDCVACHENMGDHVSSKTVKVDRLHEVRCATCHRDHQGEFGLAQQNKRYTGENCAACHADIKASFPDTKTENVKDFAKSHPDFRVQVATAAQPVTFSRLRLNAKSSLSEVNSLKFPHDVHLAAGGVRSPDGKVKMECASCHKPNTDGVGFQRVTMKDNCQRCHALKFEPSVSNREVPHGSVNQVLSTLREFYSYVSVNGVPVDRRPDSGPVFTIRPGKPQPVASYVNAPGDAKSRAIASANELFEKTSCIVCHEVSRLPGNGKEGTPAQDMPQWKIAPVTSQHVWMPKATFSHSKHVSAQCTDCHDAPKSKKATDVLMPMITQCQDCHAGKEPVVNKVTSDCGLCHGFHMPSASAPSTLTKTRQSHPMSEAHKQ
ncbi:cytochrome c3 family protein [Undibacterium sp. SXout7W]|uniref:cytochrome c3 family protein n=1 Tax=Undibacterium sp. SXout7W TaxID=3413049 RepID=UPI003BF0EE7E